LIQDTFILTTSEETPALVMKDGKIYKNLLERTVSSWPSGLPTVLMTPPGLKMRPLQRPRG
jgi:hypothetical protein